MPKMNFKYHLTFPKIRAYILLAHSKGGTQHDHGGWFHVGNRRCFFGDAYPGGGSPRSLREWHVSANTPVRRCQWACSPMSTQWYRRCALRPAQAHQTSAGSILEREWASEWQSWFSMSPQQHNSPGIRIRTDSGASYVLWFTFSLEVYHFAWQNIDG